MRTTLTLDDDLARELRERAHSGGRSFKEVVNEALRAGLAGSGGTAPTRRYQLRPAHLGELAAGIEPEKMLALADRIHDDEVIGKLRERK